MIDCDNGGNEAIRLYTVKEFNILDTPREAAFDSIVTEAVCCSNAKMAAISIIDQNRQWFKAKIGISVDETPRSVSFCAHTIQAEEMFIVEDATKDERFAKNPLVMNEPYIRFYAGVPLETDAGLRLGTLCIMDSSARTALSGAEADNLKLLGRRAMEELKNRRADNTDIAGRPEEYARYG